MSRAFPVPSASSPGTPVSSDSIEPKAATISPALLGRYVLLFELAAGGMGSVFVGRQRGAGGFERLVAIKRMHRHVLANPELVLSFHEEARIASRVNHPNVVQVIDVYELDGEHMIVMDYIEGVSLSVLMGAARRSERTLPVEVSVRVALEAARGLHAAHETLGLDGAPLLVVHRDVSPQNLLVGADGSVRVTDFGIAKAIERRVHTAQGELKGKIRYMSPEQARSHDVDRRSDVFSLGIVLWELLAGRRLYQGETELELLRQAADAVIASPATVRPELPEQLCAIVLRALAPHAIDRYQTAGDLADALERWAMDARRLATPADIARTVHELAGERLVERKRMVKEALSASQTGDAWPQVVPPQLAPELTPATSAGSIGHTSIGVEGKRRKLWLPVIGLATLIGAGVGLLALRGSVAPSGQPAASSPSPIGTSPASEAQPKAAAAQPSASASAGPSALPSASASVSPKPQATGIVPKSGQPGSSPLRSNPYD